MAYTYYYYRPSRYSSSDDVPIAAIVGISVGIFLLCIGIAYWIRRRRQNNKQTVIISSQPSHPVMVPMQAATHTVYSAPIQVSSNGNPVMNASAPPPV